MLQPRPSQAKATDLARVDEFVTIYLGDSRQSIRVPVMPSIFGHTHDKAKCYDYFANQVFPLRHLVPPAEIVAAYASHFPISTMSAENEATSIADTLFKEFFQVGNLEGRGFYNSRGREIKLKECHANNRPAGLQYFHFLSTVTPASIDDHLKGEPSFTCEFDLPLPQAFSSETGTPNGTQTTSNHSTASPSDSTATANDEETNDNIATNLFNTPNPGFGATPKMF